MDELDEARPLRRGWTTGACATAAAKAAFTALLTGEFPDPVEITLPGGQAVAFALAVNRKDDGTATAGRDQGCRRRSRRDAWRAGARHGAAGRGGERRSVQGRARRRHRHVAGAAGAAGRACDQSGAAQDDAGGDRRGGGALGGDGDVEIEISIPHGEEMAAKTLNARLGIVGGLSILGTTGVVIPYSCAAWIASIHHGIDVARATGLTHVAGATGRTSEAAVKALYDLPETALIDMGDFVGGMLKYLRTHPVPRVTIAGGIAKITKLAQGMLDLHSARGRVELGALARVARECGGSEELARRIVGANTTPRLSRLPRARAFSSAMKWRARLGRRGRGARGRSDIALDIVIFDREGKLAGRSLAKPVHAAPPKR